MHLENFIWIPSKNAIFAYVPKVACTNFKCIIRYIEGHADWLDTQIAHDRNKSKMQYLSIMKNGKDLLYSSDIKKYTVVRNPYSRILSAYKNKIEYFKMEYADASKYPFFYDIYLKVRDFKKKLTTDSKEVSFLDFLLWMQNSKDYSAKNEHWISQYDILEPEHVHFDFIGRFENLNQDSEFILKQLGCDISFPSHEDVRFPPTNASNQLSKYYSDRERDLVQKIYAKDFEAFGYAL
jgi:hypothetical protein